MLSASLNKTFPSFLLDELANLRKEYENASPEGKLFLEKRYGKRTIQQAVEESFSNDWLTEFSKQCPSCGAHIQVFNYRTAGLSPDPKHGWIGYTFSTSCSSVCCWLLLN